MGSVEAAGVHDRVVAGFPSKLGVPSADADVVEKDVAATTASDCSMRVTLRMLVGLTGPFVARSSASTVSRSHITAGHGCGRLAVVGRTPGVGAGCRRS